jgi:hypothetical protein
MDNSFHEFRDQLCKKHKGEWCFDANKLRANLQSAASWTPSKMSKMVTLANKLVTKPSVISELTLWAQESPTPFYHSNFANGSFGGLSDYEMWMIVHLVRTGIISGQ